jgi:hypothetical protein
MEKNRRKNCLRPNRKHFIWRIEYFFGTLNHMCWKAEQLCKNDVQVLCNCSVKTCNKIAFNTLLAFIVIPFLILFHSKLLLGFYGGKWRAVIAQSVQRWATGWTIVVLGFDSRRGLGIFLFTTVSRKALEPTQPPIQWVPGALSLRVKRPGCEADQSPPCSAEVKNAWSHTSTPQYVFMAWCLVKHRDNFTLRKEMKINTSIYCFDFK